MCSLGDQSECHHPRFGHILCIVSTTDIQQDEELFVTVVTGDSPVNVAE